MGRLCPQGQEKKWTQTIHLPVYIVVNTNVIWKQAIHTPYKLSLSRRLAHRYTDTYKNDYLWTKSVEKSSGGKLGE